MDLLQAGFQKLTQWRLAWSGQLVTYRRGAQTIAELRVSVGQSKFDLETSTAGVYDPIESRDYIVTASDLVLNSVQIEPARGDQIEEEDGTIYEMLPTQNAPPFRYCDPGRTALRIHTKLLSKP